MPLRPFTLARMLGLVALFLGLLSACGGGERPPPPPPPQASPSASRSSVTVNRATQAVADGVDRVAITVTVRDANGEPLAGQSVSVEVSGTGNTVTQPVGKTSASGVATAWVNSTQPGVKVVRGLVAVEDGALVLDQQPTIEFVDPPAAKLAFSTAALSATAGEPVGPLLEEVTDAFGNRSRVTSPTVVVSLSGGNPASQLSGMVAVDPADGLATFTSLFADEEGGGFKLTAGASELPTTDSNPFNVIDDFAPGMATLTSTAQSRDTITVGWTSVGDDGNLGMAASYELRYSTQPITTRAQFDAATRVTQGTPKEPGGIESVLVEGLTVATTYHLAVVIRDSVGNSSLSNSLEVATLNPCAGVVCEVPEPVCAADGVTRVTFTSACVLEDGLPTCQDTETRMACPGAEGVCFAGACGTASGPAEGELTISEVMHSPSVGTTEYIELHNASQRPLNLAGLQVDYSIGGIDSGGFTVNPGPDRAVLVPAGGVFVMGVNEDFATNGGVAVDYAYGNALELGGDGRLRLRSTSGTSLADFTWTTRFPQTPGNAMNLASSVVSTGAWREPW